ncbi:MAG: NADH-quinone oxidoreductase subunit N [Phycisphaerales bacterium]|nr:MAG: NADH-quinone oxidoreductase subunit N [Phycisphaerales bacterium]
MSADSYLAPLAPELILLIGAGVVLLAGLMQSGRRGPWVSMLALLVVLLAFVTALRQSVPDGQAAVLGLWLTPLTFYTRCIALGIGALIVLINWYQPVTEERGEYMAMILLSLLGVLLTASANDLVVLFFAIELVSIPTYVLIALSQTDQRASEASVKYFFLGAMAAAVLAYGLSFLYGVAGTTTIHTVTEGVATSTLPSGPDIGGLALVGVLLVFGGLAFKVAAVPFHVYAPDVYEGAASPVTGMLGFVPKLAGFIALIKIFSACNWDLPVVVWWIIWIVAAATMTAGNVLALLQRNVKRMLAYSSIAHTGYMLIAILVGPVAGQGPMHDGVTALLFYIAIYGAMNLGAFALLTAFRSQGRPVETLEDIAGLAVRAPLATLAFAICVFSLMGFPPTAGFLGKVYIFSSAFSLDQPHPFHGPLIALAIIGVVNSAIAAAYYLRIVSAAYIGAEVDWPVRTGGIPVRLGLALCAIPMLIVFVWPAGLAGEAQSAAALVNRSIQPQSTQVTSLAGQEGREAIPTGFNAQDRPQSESHPPGDSTGSKTQH